MRGFFHFLRNLFILALIAFGFWTYQNNPNVQIATKDSIASLEKKVGQLFSTGSLDMPEARDQEPTTSTGKTKIGAKTWSKPEASVYIDIKDNQQLRSAAIDGLSAWNRTGAFLFKQINHSKKANIIISVVDDTDTRAAGETATTYNSVSGHLLKAHIHLNRYYLQNAWYGYSNSRIVNTVEHELGHAIGLSHNKGVSVMYPAGSYYTIQPRDINAVKKMYHE